MKILHLEDNPADAEYVREILAAELPDCAITLVESRDRFLTALKGGIAPDLIISDFSLPSFDGLSALSLVREHAPDIPFVFVSGSIGEERAIAAARAGAYDYVLKDNMARLPVVLRRALDESAQRRLREQDERRLRELAGVIERAGEAIVVTDLEGRITLWNHGAVQLYGIPSAEAFGRTAVELFPAAIRDQLLEGRAAVLETGAWRRELPVSTRDGRDIVIDLHMTLVRDAAGRPSARLVLATDITEKKKFEEQFLRAQRLESIGLLAAGIAHDLNNVLAPVLMSAALLRQHVTAASDLRMLDILENSAERGSGLVRQILGFAHGVGGGLRLTQIKHLIRDISQMVQASFPKSIVLDEHVVGDLWPVQADPTQIHQVLLNLAVNARDAMLPRGGTLHLNAMNRELDEAAARAITGASPGAYVLLEVVDTGSGMTPEVLARMWEPFFTTKGEGKGTGLGLSTVRGIAARHGGFVTVDTKVGHGTSFSVFLPAAEHRGIEGFAASTPSVPRGDGELILVVDDERAVRETAASIFNQHGYRTLACSDGVEAIGIFSGQSAEIRAVVTDLNMPNLDGPSLARVLRRLRPDVKILAMTGLGSARGASSSPFEPAPFDAKVQKPFTVDALLTAVHRLLHPPASAPSSGRPA